MTRLVRSLRPLAFAAATLAPAVAVADHVPDWLSPLVQDASDACVGWSKTLPTSGYAEDMKNLNIAGMYIDEAKSCLKRVDELLAGGRSPDQMVPYNAYGACPKEEQVRLADVKEKVCQPALDALNKNLQGTKAEIDAKWAPFVKLLSGEKKEIFEKEVKESNRGFWGPKRKRLETPQDFAKASAWYIESGDTDAVGVYHYSIHGWQFAGMKKKATYHKDGTTSGGNPPPSAYP